MKTKFHSFNVLEAAGLLPLCKINQNHQLGYYKTAKVSF